MDGEEREKDDGKELVPIKIRRATYRLVKTVAAWRGISALDYLDELVQREATPDLQKVVEDITRLGAKKRRTS
jgi:hypothetical protein